jgi:hypothetical protein
MKAPDRRMPGRPREGQTRACTECIRGTLEFCERVRLPDIKGYVPAWTCNQCARIEPVRVQHGSAL